MNVRTRFAPSPTGFLHIGSVRTALYCWLYARKMKGTFILRIEDTDRKRSTPESVNAILEGMAWLNLDYDEGPIYQTQRFDRYREVIQQLLIEGKAYRCYCSKERLEKMREEQMAKKEKPRYDGFCRNRTDHPSQQVEGGLSQQVGGGVSASYVVRFKNPMDGKVEFEDLVRGKLSFANAELDDLIIARTDGTPTYNFTVVVDDLDMRITHVIRGDDHINNTPRQINILRALGAALPLYAHIPMILGADGKRLSKRHGAVSVLQYREEGYLPEALINYLARLGWSHGDQEIFSVEELINYFDISNINRAAAAFNPEKLLWLNQYYIKNSDPAHVAKELAWQMNRLGINTNAGPALVEIIKAQSERTKTLLEMAERSRFFYEEVSYEQPLKTHFNLELAPALKVVMTRLSNLSGWKKQDIHEIIVKSAADFSLKLGKLAQPIRIALTGGTASPPIDTTIELLGRERTLKRLETAIKLCSG